MSDTWKQRLLKIAPWILFVGTFTAYLGNGCQGPPPMPPLLDKLEKQQDRIEKQQEQIAEYVAKLAENVAILSENNGLKSPPSVKLDGNSTHAEVRAALLADLDRLLAQRSWIVGEEQKKLLRAVRWAVDQDDAFIAIVMMKLK